MDGRVRPGAAFEVGIGGGKTLSAIEEIAELLARKPRSETLILAINATIDTVWREQLNLFLVDPDACYLNRGTLKDRIQLLETERHAIWVASHETLPALGTAMVAHHFSFIIIDEHQKYRSPNSRRSKILLGRGGVGGALSAPFRLILSGTPVIKRGTDVYVSYKWLGALPGTLERFRERFLVMGGYGDREELAIRDPEGLNAALNDFRFVVPEPVRLARIWETRRVTLPAWQRAAYKRVKKELKTRYLTDKGEVIERDITQTAVALLRLAQITAGFEAIDSEHHNWRPDNAKTQELLENVVPLLTGQQWILWVWYRAEVVALNQALRDAGLSVATFYGGQTAEEKAEEDRRFKSGEAEVMVANMAAGGAGQNWPDAKAAVYYTRSFDTEAWVQSLGRNARMTTQLKSGESLMVIVLEAEDTVDQHISAVLGRDIATAAGLSIMRIRQILG